MYVIKGMDVLPGNVVRKSVLLITLLFLNPLGHIFQYFRTDGFFQLPVFGQCAFFAGLQQMVQVRIAFTVTFLFPFSLILCWMAVRFIVAST